MDLLNSDPFLMLSTTISPRKRNAALKWVWYILDKNHYFSFFCLKEYHYFSQRQQSNLLETFSKLITAPVESTASCTRN